MQERHLRWPPYFFLGPAVPPASFFILKSPLSSSQNLQTFKLPWYFQHLLFWILPVESLNYPLKLLQWMFEKQPQ